MAQHRMRRRQGPDPLPAAPTISQVGPRDGGHHGATLQLPAARIPSSNEGVPACALFFTPGRCERCHRVTICKITRFFKHYCTLPIAPIRNGCRERQNTPAIDPQWRWAEPEGCAESKRVIAQRYMHPYNYCRSVSFSSLQSRAGMSR